MFANPGLQLGPLLRPRAAGQVCCAVLGWAAQCQCTCWACPCVVCCRTGVIPAPEFAERFYSVFAATPGNVRHELFMQLALLVPQPAKRLELLQQAQDVSGGHREKLAYLGQSAS
jgi:hypothetical protein